MRNDKRKSLKTRKNDIGRSKKNLIIKSFRRKTFDLKETKTKSLQTRLEICLHVKEKRKKEKMNEWQNRLTLSTDDMQIGWLTIEEKWSNQMMNNIQRSSRHESTSNNRRRMIQIHSRSPSDVVWTSTEIIIVLIYVTMMQQWWIF